MTIREAAAFLQARNRFLLLTHARPDGDTLASAAALALGLRALGKTAYLLPALEATWKYKGYVEPLYAPAGYAPETVVSVDIATEDLFPENAAGYKGAVTLSLDHHGSNTFYAENTCVFPDCAACGQVIYDLLLALGAPVTAEIASLLYIAITTDTGCFQYANTTEDTLRIAANLVACGAENAKLNKIFFRTKSRPRIEIEGLALAGMEFHANGKVAIVTITLKMLARTGADAGDLDDIASIPNQIEGVQVGITVKEQTDGSCKISVRTSPEVNANAICAAFGGGGHAMAAGCTISAPVEQAKQLLLGTVREVCQ